MKNNQNYKPKKYDRVQDEEWENIKGSMKLLYVYKSDKGNIKGIYSDGKRKVSHWMTEEERDFYLKLCEGGK